MGIPADADSFSAALAYQRVQTSSSRPTVTPTAIVMVA